MDLSFLQRRPFFLTNAQLSWVRATLSAMTVEEKCGQIFVAMGQDYSPELLARLVGEGRVGGILFRPEPAQRIRARYEALDAQARIPLLKAANLEEGGTGAISDGTLFGWPMLTAATDDPDVAERFGLVCAAEGRGVGINWTFSPVCDLDMNFRNPITNVRTFGSDLNRVREMTSRYVDAVQRCGLAACAKHFPGDGVDFRDQHLHPTCNSLSAPEWYATYGEVYRSLIDQGLLSVMAGHITQPAVTMDVNPTLTYEDCLPASLCPELLTGVLRNRLGFNGLITSDATIMGGYTMAMPRSQAIPASVAAGCDMLVFSTDLEEDERYLLQGVNQGMVSPRRLDEAVARVLALKAKVCGESLSDAPEEKMKAAQGAYPDQARAKQWHREAARKAITLVKHRQPDLFPVTPERYPEIRLIFLGNDELSGESLSELALRLLRERGFRASLYRPELDDLHGTSRLSRHRLTLYLANYEQASNQVTVRARWNPKHALDIPRFLNEEPCVFVSLANPYLLQDVPRIKTYLNAYTATPTVIETVMDLLMSGGPFFGVSPVDAFCGLPDAQI